MNWTVQVTAVRENLPKLNAMLAVVDACAAAGVSYPPEVKQFFSDALDRCGPDAVKLREAMERVELPVRGDIVSEEGIVIDLKDLPEHATALCIRASQQAAAAETVEADLQYTDAEALSELDTSLSLNEPDQDVADETDETLYGFVPPAAEPQATATAVEESPSIGDEEAAADEVEQAAPVASPPAGRTESEPTAAAEVESMGEDEEFLALGEDQQSDVDEQASGWPPNVTAPSVEAVADEDEEFQLADELPAAEAPASVTQPEARSAADDQWDELWDIEEELLQFADEEEQAEQQSARGPRSASSEGAQDEPGQSSIEDDLDDDDLLDLDSLDEPTVAVKPVDTLPADDFDKEVDDLVLAVEEAMDQGEDAEAPSENASDDWIELEELPATDQLREDELRRRKLSRPGPSPDDD